MPAKSKAQQQAMGIAHAIQQGEMKGKPGSPSAEIAKTMKPKDVTEFASTSRTGLPKKLGPQAPAPPSPSPRPKRYSERMKVNQTPTGAIKNLGPAKR